MTPFSKRVIVVPVDFSDVSFNAVDVALEMADDAAQIHVIHVLPELNPVEPGVVWQTIDDESRKDHATQMIRDRLADPRYERVNVKLAIGDPGYRIANFAESVDCGLIITPSHGRSGISRLLLGSVAERVMRLAHCPVLVLRN